MDAGHRAQIKIISSGLITISEQKSIATIQTIPSNSTFNRRIVSLQQPVSTFPLRKELEHDGNQRRQCVSLDENAIHRYHHKGTESCVGLSSGEQSPESCAKAIPEPTQPPFAPPERVKTPEGVPSWHGQVCNAPTNRTAAVTSRAHPLFRQLRARSSQVLRRVLGEGRPSVTAQSRTFRPPVSGHCTQTYEQMTTHPFHTAPLAGEHNITRDTHESGRNIKHSLSNIQLRGQNGGPCDSQPHRDQSSAQDTSARPARLPTQIGVQSPSQRALRAASGNAIPVSPHRAQKVARAVSSGRSVSITNACQSQTSRSNDHTTQPWAVPNGTMNTMELIQQFPEPPSGPALRTVPDRQANMPLFSLFSPNQEERVSEPVMSGAASSRYNNEARREGVSSVDQSRHKIQRKQLRNDDAARSQSSEVQTQVNEPLVRGESLCRYRHSGPPIYDNDASSLRSFDEQHGQGGDRLSTLNVIPLARPDSALTGNTRYFSAASRSLGTRIMSPAVVSEQEHDRAVANGALRFVGSGTTSPANVPNRLPVLSLVSPTSTGDNENDFPITPVTVTQASKIHCRHR